jgi:crotonobetaine/carnitine-CoA ligase
MSGIIGEEVIMASDYSNWAVLLEKQAAERGEKPFLYEVYNDRYVSYREMNENANRFANFIQQRGAQPGEGIAMLMNNSQQFLDVFFGMQKVGMYVNTVNTALRGDGLAYIIDNSDTKYLVVDYDLVDLYQAIRDKIPQVKEVIVNPVEAPQNYKLPEGVIDLRDCYSGEMPATKPSVDFPEDSILIIMYTSGTTGLPKGVVSRYNKNVVERIKPLAELLLSSDTVYYTALPLFHGNALFITTTETLIVGGTMALSKRFSASRFWDEIYQSKATLFNTIGAIIPILMKQPEHPHERDHRVEHVMSAGCPTDMWEPFEKRFQVSLWEGYAAIDGSGLILNLGDGPKGSLGKPVASVIKIVDEQGDEVPGGEIGELLFQVPQDRESRVEYYKNPEATGEKTRGGWEYTGDLMYQDEAGFLYFVGRSTDSMRRRGENVSAFDVEKEILKHPAVLECAVYAVPSELTEDEIMASISIVEGKSLKPEELYAFLQDKLAKFAIPRYIRIVGDFPRTETFRIKKNELKSIGVTADTYDAG